jgi:hypothetical protein
MNIVLSASSLKPGMTCGCVSLVERS